MISAASPRCPQASAVSVAAGVAWAFCREANWLAVVTVTADRIGSAASASASKSARGGFWILFHSRRSFLTARPVGVGPAAHGLNFTEIGPLA